MKKAIKNLILIRIEIKELKKIIKITEKCKFFEIFGNEKQRNEEILILRNELKGLLKLEFTALENVQRKCELAKVKNYYESRKN